MSIINFTIEKFTDFLNKNFSNISSYNEVISNFKKLDEFIHKNEYELTLDLLGDLINNNPYFNKSLKILVDHDISVGVYESDLDYDNPTTLLAVNVYCRLNNIEIKQDDQEFTEEDMECLLDKGYDGVKIYIKQATSPHLLTNDEEKEYLIRIKNGDIKAKKRFIECNLRLVINIAKRFIGRGIPFIDLIQDGNMGLMKAVDKFEIERGFKFSTYATWWIKQSITRDIQDNSRNIRLPVHLQEKIWLVNNTSIKLSKKLNRKPTDEEIAEETELPLEFVKNIYQYKNDVISLNTPVDDDEKQKLEDVIADDSRGIDDLALDSTFSENIKRYLEESNLSELQKYVLIHRFGLFGEKKMTLQQLGAEYNVTRERIRQIEGAALRKFKVYCTTYTNLGISYGKATKDVDLNNQSAKDHGNGRHSKTIFEYLEDYGTRLEILYAISKLRDKDKYLLTLRYGQDLDNPVFKVLTNCDRKAFYDMIYRLKKILTSPDFPRRSSTINSNHYYKDNNENIIDVTNKDTENNVTINPPSEEKTILTNDNIQIENNVKSQTNCNKKNKEEKKMRIPKTIFELLKQHGTRDEILCVISKLTDDEKALLELRYGQDLDNPVFGKLSKTDAIKFSNLVARMKLMLKNPNFVRRTRKSKTVSNNSSKEEAKPVALTNDNVESVKQINEEIQNNVQPKDTEENKKDVVLEGTIVNSKKAIEAEEKDLNKEDCIKILELLKTPTFFEMMKALSVKDAVIISLKLGYIDDKYFSNNSIAEFLKINVEEVEESFKKTLLLYKENFNGFIDKLIDGSNKKYFK